MIYMYEFKVVTGALYIIVLELIFHERNIGEKRFEKSELFNIENLIQSHPSTTKALHCYKRLVYRHCIFKSTVFAVLLHLLF